MTRRYSSDPMMASLDYLSGKRSLGKEPEEYGMEGFEIFVNNKRYTTPSEELTGDQIKQLAGIPPNYELFIVHGNDSTPIGPTQEVEIKNGEHFRAIPPGTFGRNVITSVRG